MAHIPTIGRGTVCAVLLALVVGAACGAARTHSPVETPASAGTSGYRTYRWWQPPLSQTTEGYTDNEERLDWAVRLLVERELSARGYSADATGRPDFVMRYGVALYRETTQSYRDYLSYRADGGGKDMGAADGAPAGTFALEAIDAASGRVAWRVTIPAVFEHGPSENPVRPAVTEMMKSFPQRP